MRRWLPLPIALIALSVWLLTREDPARPTREHAAPPTSDRALDLLPNRPVSSETAEPAETSVSQPRSSVTPATLVEATGPREAPESRNKPRFAIPSLVGEEHHENWARVHLNFSPWAVTVITGHFPGEDLSVWAFVTSKDRSNAERASVKCEHLKLTDGELLVCVPTVGARVEQRVVLELRRGDEDLDRVEIQLPFHRENMVWAIEARMRSILDFPGYSALRLAYSARRRAGMSRLDALKEMRTIVVDGARLFRAAYSPSADETDLVHARARVVRKALDEIERKFLRRIDRKLEREADAR